MPSDVVDRLKYQSGWNERSPYMGTTGELLWDAIDEIVRLRALTESTVAKPFDWRDTCRTGEEL